MFPTNFYASEREAYVTFPLVCVTWAVINISRVSKRLQCDNPSRKALAFHKNNDREARNSLNCLLKSINELLQPSYPIHSPFPDDIYCFSFLRRCRKENQAINNFPSIGDWSGTWDCFFIFSLLLLLRPPFGFSFLRWKIIRTIVERAHNNTSGRESRAVWFLLAFTRCRGTIFTSPEEAELMNVMELRGSHGQSS